MVDPFAIAFGLRLRGLRESRNLTQRQLAKLAGVSSTAINYFETGKRGPTLRLTLKLCWALNVTVAYMIDLSVYQSCFEGRKARCRTSS